MDRQQLLDCLNLNDNFVFDNQVQTISAVEPYFLIDDREWLLLVDLKPSQPELKN